ncbi:DUF6879 family protein [Streptomyces sp. CRN 30]|uniref:DUF6879 family protein n=1 Tax=Streptomyces sp. CRN 30 TaxID=3075613 RepID=UPI002A81B835|nr:DUF6879 family protein [Streptomyces sp. CRN 30]
MALKFLGTTSDGGDCPTLYEIEGTDEVLVQGDRETDPEHLVQLRDVKPEETFVRVPRQLLTRFAPRAEPGPLIPFGEAAHYLTDLRHTAWRLETRRGYAADRRSEPWARWQAGQDVAHDEPDAWRRNVAEQTARGVRYGRVRIVDDPPTEGQRFLLTRAPSNVAVGDEVRYLWRSEAEQLGLPDFDFWLVDSRFLLRFRFDAEDNTLGVVVSEDPAEVLAACQARDAAWHHAVPAEQFAEQVASTV